MREYEERREIEKFYDTVKKNIKSMLEAKGVQMKGSAKGSALSEILGVIDEAMEIGMAEELVTARNLCRAYYKKYSDVISLERQISDKKKELEQQNKVVDLVSHLTDETLKNAIIAYNAMDDNRGRYGNREDVKAIVIAYINSKGREDLKDVIEVTK